jgi:site-specific recombinase XerD
MLSRDFTQKNSQKNRKSCASEHTFVTIMRDMQSNGLRHNEQLNLFGVCACLACVLLRLVTRVINDDFPTDIDAFQSIVIEHIMITPDGELSTRREATRHIKRFVKWCEMNDIKDITLVKQENVEAFVNWPTVMGGRARTPGSSTKRNRLGGLRRAFKALRQMGYELPDPTIDVVALLDRTFDANVCSDDDIDKLRDGAPVGLFDSCNAALLALAEAGATNGEVKEIRASDVNLEDGVVRLPGNARVDERINELTEWGAIVLRERLAHISGDNFVVVNVYGAKASEASVSQMFRLIASYGNVGRRGFNINSVRAWRARSIYMENGRIQDAALFLGNRSLDAAVALMGVEWRQTI